MKKKKVNYSTFLSINDISVPEKCLAHWVDVSSCAEVQREDGVSTNLPNKEYDFNISRNFGSQLSGAMGFRERSNMKELRRSRNERRRGHQSFKN